MKEREFIQLASRMPLFTFKQISAQIGNMGYSKIYIHRLIGRGLIKKLKRGIYTVHDDPVIYASHICYPSYISLWYAFSHHGTTTQIPQTIEVMSHRNGTVSGVKLIQTKYLWGYSAVNYNGFKIFMADLEKAIVDAIITQRVPLDEVETAIRQCNSKKLEEYALKTDLSTMKKIGFVAEASGVFMKRLYTMTKDDRNYVRTRYYIAEKSNKWKVAYKS
ncbi:MAG: type IV toxin-antitoxin system AbiEi family antitoxin domain-containing protein [Thermoplasmata archaeon]